jgi:hypothetical protein
MLQPSIERRVSGVDADEPAVDGGEHELTF